MNFTDIPTINDQPSKNIKEVDSQGVPSDDEEVKRMLRKFGEPVTTSGEGPGTRRERLKNVLNERSQEPVDLMDEDNEEDEVFYTPGSEKLLQSRKFILSDSLHRAQKRVKAQSESTKDPIKILKHRRSINEKLNEFELTGSQVIQGVTRTVSSLRVCPSQNILACGSWDGSVSILNRSNLKTITRNFQGHKEKVGSLDWKGENMLVSGGQEGTINQWEIKSTDETPTMRANTIEKAHEDRITSTTYHPSSNYIASTSFDQTWKFWDAATQTELLAQEGHSKAVLCGSFQCDGSIFSSGSQDAMARLWDMRSGRCISTLQGHAQAIHGIDFSPNGYHLATASADCLVKIWDLRKLSATNATELFTIPAHTKLVSGVRFFHSSQFPGALAQEVTNEEDEAPEILDSNGTFLVTSSFDGLVNVWSADNWIKVCSLRGHTDKVTCCDITGEGNNILSGGWDKNIRIWGNI